MAETLPLFPLGTVLLPGASLPLHIFEPRYRQLVADLVTGTVPDRRFGVVAIRQGWEVGPDNAESLYEVGCSALLREARRLPDARFDAIAVGERRFQLLDVDHDGAPYLIGRVEWLPDTDPPEEEASTMPGYAEAVLAAHRRYCDQAWHREDWTAPPPAADPDLLAYLVAADSLLPVEDRQRLLAETSPARRLRMIRSLLCRETEFLRVLHAVPLPLAEYATEITPN
ncbi:LON peptidase substrate-binding domain-containing protein [Goodfellowiella coeruleoviolacea]|uniref:Lon N-terminal domain-containing protein n=1 Tax=Goodfellowiella coeruleoviolacea TaxID=334858 RepID=A0AAE3KKL9_9PSEU|nr:LON peptidase substrate-binding domain-containing protein [Goodfellowiella coeruleoviolacea]MCP2169504.1 hypothetical protein [Goodfellowiella coeruleoviolacea]